MKWMSAIGHEIKSVLKLSLADLGSVGLKRRVGWLQDKHLRTGYFLCIPIFILVIPTILFVHSSPIRIGLILLLVIVSNLVWLGFAAWSRSKESQNP